MRNGKPVTWTCPIQKECVDCGERYWCWSDEEIVRMDAEKKGVCVLPDKHKKSSGETE